MKVSILFGCYILLASFLFSQDQGTLDWVVPSMNLGDFLLMKQALLPNQSMKLQVLEELEMRLRTGTLSSGDRPALYILKRLAEEGVTDRAPSGGARNFPEVRRKAAFLLGYLKGTEARSILQGILFQDPEPMVIAEAVHALRRQPPPLTLEESAGIVEIFSRHILPKQEANLAYATLLLLREHPPNFDSPFSSELFSFVLRISDLPFPKEVRTLAREVIQHWIQPVGN
ncbi:MAG: HEAT repeat domain-containing protein [Spirochaetes bacterium]|nr:HEAT repeat domain-containing protein [Spirochaetota bacterium]